MKKRIARIKALELAIDIIHDHAVVLHDQDENDDDDDIAEALLVLMKQLERKLQRSTSDEKIVEIKKTV